MKKFYKSIIDHPKAVFIIFAMLCVIGFVCKPLISVNYDMNDYLPSDSVSTIALEVMENEYAEGIPNARIMLENVSISEALDYKEKIQKVEGVVKVIWLDDVESIAKPIEAMNSQVVADYYEDGNALLTVTIDKNARLQAVEQIRDLIGENNSMTGSAVSTAEATTSTMNEVSKITVIAILFVLFVLLLTTSSWVEPLIILIGLGVAVIINAGSNILFGEISFVTNAAGSILQIAVSLDYSVFLIHRFEEYKKTEACAKDAMVKALCMSTSSILSSGLTTVIGFLALCLMRFQIGPDMGLALAKGIAVSLISVFVFIPVLILYTYKLIDKTAHRSYMPKFNKMGKAILRMRIPILCMFCFILLPSYLASNSNDFYYGSSHIFGTETKLGSDTQKIESVFGKNDTYVLLVPNNDSSTQKELSKELSNIPQITKIISYVDTVGSEIPEQYLDKGTLSQLNSENFTRMVLSVNTDYEGDETFSLVQNIRKTADKYYPDHWHLAGEGVSTYDLMDTVTQDMVKVNAIAIVSVFIVLCITMKSFLLPLILVLSIEAAIWINLSIPYFKGDTIFYIAYLIISSIQLGATVDYAILLTERYKEFRKDKEREESIKQTLSTVTTSILTSGSVLTVVGFLLGNISTHGLLSQLGYFLGIGTVCSLIVVLFVLPILLYLFDRKIMKINKKHTIQLKKETISS